MTEKMLIYGGNQQLLGKCLGENLLGKSMGNVFHYFAKSLLLVICQLKICLELDINLENKNKIHKSEISIIIFMVIIILMVMLIIYNDTAYIYTALQVLHNLPWSIPLLKFSNHSVADFPNLQKHFNQSNEKQIEKARMLIHCNRSFKTNFLYLLYREFFNLFLQL